jgi:ATP synthase protein I
MSRLQIMDRDGGIVDAPNSAKKLAARLQKRQNAKNDFSGLAMHEGVYVLVPILLGLGVGYGLDTYFQTRPLFVMILLVAGTVSAFYNMFRLLKKT